jgi:hypothetical protein
MTSERFQRVGRGGAGNFYLPGGGLGDETTKNEVCFILLLAFILRCGVMQVLREAANLLTRAVGSGP